MELSDSNKYLNEYLEANTSKEDEVLVGLKRFTWLHASHPRMMSSPVQGKFLEMLSKILQPERILEVGTFTGYSAICMAHGLNSGGKLFTIDINDELQEKAKIFFKKAGLSEKIKCLSGDALLLIPELKDKFDLIFIDGEKEQYIDYYNLCMPKLKSGGILLADNVLWDGKVLDPILNNDSATRAIYSFNEYVMNDKQVENVILPLRDGISVIRKK